VVLGFDMASGHGRRGARPPQLYFTFCELKGDRKGAWSVTIQANWRITFRFAAGDA
jgi:plasmid maintenance system killer protein